MLLVALRKESVDRNTLPETLNFTISVALRKESVDRNGSFHPAHAHQGFVALRKESVDRNYGDDLTFTDGSVSLSARRAWIEMPTLC